MSDVIETPDTHVLRGVRPINLMGVDVASADAAKPEFEWVDPGVLLIDDGYQRNLSERSMKLVRKICAGWDWRRFKPPVCARTDRGLEVIDGQHTAIAACSHPDVTEIPVMVVVAASRSDRAQSFIGHNRDRLNITPMQMHFAAAAAGDEDAQDIDRVCERAGVKLLKATPGNGAWKAGETVAVKAIGALINRRGVVRAREVLEVLIKGQATPISTVQIRAVECLLHDDEYREDIDADGVVNAMLKLGFMADQEAAVFAATHKVPVFRALAIVLFRKGKRRARRS
ncbi:DUF6551 family protein [uncultured Brevundimonas sp.]|uniref:DUF6551 family protein n=1 Tax=uncultured Brevundimonas sp. TaxID=213418 RepID=UPI0025EF89B1|nr:DUF6551 family protein [uncultured Brevundimonas sp.]